MESWPCALSCSTICISAHLKETHIALLGYVSAFYPLCLILLTWVCIELHGRNLKPLILLWRPIHGLLVKLRRGCDLSHSDLIGTFSSFFFLSYSKLIFQSTMLLTCQTMGSYDGNIIQQVMLIDPSTDCRSSQHLQFAIPALLILLFCVILPSILFLLYSTRRFQACLSKCHLTGPHLAMLNIFMEKYHSCCRDGLEGGRDLRIFAGFYFILRIIICLYGSIPGSWRHSLTFWTYQTILFSTAALVIAFVKPYKNTYMNFLDALLLALTALLSHLLSRQYKLINPTFLFVMCILPAVGFGLCNILWITNRLRRWITDFFKQKCCNGVVYSAALGCVHGFSTSEQQRLLLPTHMTVETTNYQTNYQTINWQCM